MTKKMLAEGVKQSPIFLNNYFESEKGSSKVL